MLDADDPGRIVGVFDWEMCAVGDPLIDLGILLCYWVHTAKATQRDALTSVTDWPGWFTREEILERYAAQTSFNLPTSLSMKCLPSSSLPWSCNKSFSGTIRADGRSTLRDARRARGVAGTHRRCAP